MTQPAFRIVVLGAGFSAPAGLPLGSGLFAEVRRLAQRTYGADNHLESDLARYVHFRTATLGLASTPETVDFEEFLSFLDIEHYLGLKGKGTWSDQGNESQLIIKGGIATVLCERMPAELPRLYEKFARSLTHTDVVLTFNYDCLVERALERTGVPYRLFPDRYSEIGWASNTIDDSREELVLLKLHGSIDWFNRQPYEDAQRAADAHPLPFKIKHPLFDENPIAEAIPIADGPRAQDDPLAKVYRVRDLGPLLD